MTIGIFGGSFNPIHVGHINLAKGIMQTGLIDELWFMVSPHNPLKEESSLMPDKERFELVCKAVEKIKGVKASDFEFHLRKPSFMYLTLRKLYEEYPQHDFVLVIGADNWLCFDKWKEYEEILSNHKIIIYPRKGYEIDKQSLPENVTFLDLPLYDISSTQIRQMIARGEDVSKLIAT